MKIILSFLSIVLLPSLASSVDIWKKTNIEPLVLKIDGKDERAVIKTLDGKMHVIKPGDLLRASSSPTENDKSLRVVEIADGRIVLEEKQGQSVEKIIVRLENGKQSVERVGKAPEKQKQVYKIR